VLLNMLIAIISDAYEEAVEEISKEADIALLKMIFQYLRELVRSIHSLCTHYTHTLLHCRYSTHTLYTLLIRYSPLQVRSIPIVGKFFVRGEEIATKVAGKSGGCCKSRSAVHAIDVQDEGSTASAMAVAAASNKFTKQMTSRHLLRTEQTKAARSPEHRRTSFLGSLEHLVHAPGEQLEHLVRGSMPKKGLRSLQNKILHGKTNPKDSSNGRHGEGGAGSSSAVDASNIQTMVAATLDSKLEQFKTDLLASLRSGGGQSGGGRSGGGGWESSRTKQAQWELGQLSPLPKLPPPVHRTRDPSIPQSYWVDTTIRSPTIPRNPDSPTIPRSPDSPTIPPPRLGPTHVLPPVSLG
jgi:uncharacterized membrane protein YgcG